MYPKSLEFHPGIPHQAFIHVWIPPKKECIVYKDLSDQKAMTFLQVN